MMDKTVLKQWLKAGFMEENIFKDTLEGTPQGGIASPTLANIALDGLEKVVNDLSEKKDSIQFVRYADDFICTAKSKETLQNKVLPVIIEFLKERGLELSMEKTKITHIDEGFDFLGFNIRKYGKNGKKLLIKPSATSIKKITESLRKTIQVLGNALTTKLIASLNSKIRGWTNYYRSSVAKKIFADIDKKMFVSLWNMLKSKHRNKNLHWVRNKYFTRIERRNWCFFCKVKTKTREKIYTLIQAAKTKIRRHVKIKGKATPFDDDFKEYFTAREDRLKQERINSRIVNNYYLKGARAV
jgi:RNA-directed DNA polymerase